MKFRFISSVLCLAAAAVTMAQIPIPKYRTDRILVRYKPGITGPAIQTMNAPFGATVVWYDAPQRIASIKFPGTKTVSQAISYFSSQSMIERAVKSMAMKKHFTPNDPMLGQQYGFTNIKAFTCWDFNKGLASVKIAVIDDGIQMDHPDLKNKIVDAHDVIDGDNNPTPAPGGNTHGTHTGGIAAAETNNAIGIAGTGFNCRIMPIRVFDNSGVTFDDIIIPAIRWAIDHNAKVISMSLGGLEHSPTGNPLFQTIVDEAWSKNIIIVASAGNDNTEIGSGVFNFPSDYNHVVSVAASDNFNARAVFSNFGDVDVTAPGVDIQSTLINSGYGKLSGTSMSCPMVSGVVGTMWSAAPNGTPAQRIVDTLFNTCVPVGNYVKRGLVDMNRSVRAAAAQTKELAPTPNSVTEGSPITDSFNVVVQDSEFFRIVPNTVPGLGQVGSAVFKFNIGTDVVRTQLIQLDVTHVAKFANGSTGQIYILNWSTGQWVIWKSFPLNGTTPVTTKLTLKSGFTTYLSAAGEYRIMIRGLMPASAGLTANTFDTDYLASKIIYVKL